MSHITSKASIFLSILLFSAISFSQVGPLQFPSLSNITFTNIDVPGADATVASGINNSGAIVGEFLDSSGAFHGFMADKEGKFVKAIDFPGAAQTEPLGINEKGDIVGAYINDDGVLHGFLLSDGSFSTIDFPAAVGTFPGDINDQGVIAGTFEDAALAFHGFMLDKTGFHTIDDPAQGSVPSTQLISINSKGDILGDFAADENGIFHGAFLLKHGEFIPFSVPGATQGIFALGLSNNNDVAGSFLGDSFAQHGFLDDNGVVISFDFPGSLATAPLQVNTSRHIVGIYADRAVNTHSFLVTFDGPGTGPASVAASAIAEKTDTSNQITLCGLAQHVTGSAARTSQNMICHQ